MRILTYGRLGKEFEVFANKQDNISCKYVDENELQEYIKDYECIAGLYPNVDLDISHVKWIHSFSAGVDSWLSRNDLNPELILTKTIGRMNQKMGEYCLAYILMDIKQLHLNVENQKELNWQKPPQEYLSNMTVMVLGTADIGLGVANAFKPFAKRIIGVNTDGRHITGFDAMTSLNNIEKTASVDIVVNTLPATKDTENVINRDFFSCFQGVRYMNVGRGATDHIDDLLWALENGFAQKAILDVFDKEPLPEDSRLWNHQCIFISPHNAAVTDINDVMLSFPKAREAFKNNMDNKLRVNLSRGY